MKLRDFLFACTTLGLLTSCSVLKHRAEDDNSRVSAAPLIPISRACDLPPPSTTGKENASNGQNAAPALSALACSSRADAAFSLIAYSREKCRIFVDSLTDDTSRDNVGLDIASTTFSSLVGVFTRPGIKNALGAGSAISTGAKTSISSNYFAQQTLGHIIQAIEAIYNPQIDAVADWVRTTQSNGTFNLFDAEQQIKGAHSLCSLAAANAKISTAIPPVTDSQKPEAPKQLSFLFVEKADSGNPSAPADKSLADMATSLVAEFNDPKNATFRGAGITADTKVGSGKISFIYGSEIDSVQWAVAVTNADQGAPNVSQKIAYDDKTKVIDLNVPGSTSPRIGDTIAISVASLKKKDGQQSTAAPPAVTPAPAAHAPAAVPAKQAPEIKVFSREVLG
jgi:hypothetical protein